MSKQDKYINYIVDNLVKNTEIDYEEERINYPFFLHSSPVYFPFLHLSSSTFFYLYFSFTEYVKETYGTKDEEIQTIWDQYKERIQTLINNE